MSGRPLEENVDVAAIFAAFLVIGATSFGGGVVGHLRNSLVVKHRWLDDTSFLKTLTISQTLPGLNAANMAILVGDRLRGAPGAIAALAGICLPGAALMYTAGIMYQAQRQRPLLEAALEGVAAAAAGLILATVVRLGRQSLSRIDDLAFVGLTVICVNRLDMSVPRVLVAVGTLAVAWHAVRAITERPHR